MLNESCIAELKTFFGDDARVDCGNGMRLEPGIASSAFPLYDRNPGSVTLSRPAMSRDWRRSTQIVHHSEGLPSALFLPAAEAPL
jgi:uncharacterized protein